MGRFGTRGGAGKISIPRRARPVPKSGLNSVCEVLGGCFQRMGRDRLDNSGPRSVMRKIVAHPLD